MIDFLKKVPLFAGLPEADLELLCRMAEEVRLSTGEKLFAEGSPGDRAYIICEGELEILKISGSRKVLLDVQTVGAIIGEMALLEKAPRMASVRARTDSLLLAIHQEQFDRLLDTSPSALRAMMHTIVTRWRNTEGMLRQSEKMIQMGTLTAGVAHELNNPAAAVKRGAGQLHTALARFGETQFQVGGLALTETQQAHLQTLAQRAREQALQPATLGALTRSDREAEIETWLEKRQVPEAWVCASTLVNLNYDVTELSALAEHLPPEGLATIINWLNAVYTTHNLLAEIGQSAGRISETISALKSYSYLDQAPVQAVDVCEGLDHSLLILRHKLPASISIQRDYAAGLPKIHAYGSELNQVWTNILDNAVDALAGQGEITLRTRQNGGWVVVEIEDNGPGIPPEIQPKIFDPFFTTKPPGAGTGLGLDISYNIIAHKHRGDIKVFSRPGRTRFQVWLPVNFEAQ